jgi:hypothetical protein
MCVAALRQQARLSGAGSVSVTTTQWNDEHWANKRTAPADFSKRTFAFECLGLLNYGFDKLPAHELCVVLMCGPPETTSRPHTPYVNKTNSMAVFYSCCLRRAQPQSRAVTWLCAPCRRVSDTARCLLFLKRLGWRGPFPPVPSFSAVSGTTATTDSRAAATGAARATAGTAVDDFTSSGVWHKRSLYPFAAASDAC